MSQDQRSSGAGAGPRHGLFAHTSNDVNKRLFKGLINIKPLKLKAEEKQSHKHLLQRSAYHQLLIWRQWKCAAEIIGFIRV